MSCCDHPRRHRRRQGTPLSCRDAPTHPSTPPPYLTHPNTQGMHPPTQSPSPNPTSSHLTHPSSPQALFSPHPLQPTPPTSPTPHPYLSQPHPTPSTHPTCPRNATPTPTHLHSNVTTDSSSTSTACKEPQKTFTSCCLVSREEHNQMTRTSTPQSN